MAFLFISAAFSLFLCSPDTANVLSLGVESDSRPSGRIDMYSQAFCSLWLLSFFLFLVMSSVLLYI